MTAVRAGGRARDVVLLTACLLVLLALLGLGVSARATAGDQAQLVPAYFTPDAAGAPWPAACRGMRTGDGGSLAVLNPADGPGGQADPRYAAVIEDCRAQGHRVLGYVSTAYGARPPADVAADIDRYQAFYGVDGVFVDEMAEHPRDPATGQDMRAYYRQVYDHVAARTGGTGLVVGNPGLAADTAWQLEEPVADVLVVFEGTAADYEAWAPPGWTAAHPAAHFAHLVHTAPGASLRHLCELSRARNAGHVYVTDDTGANPWDTLPSYWDRVAPSCG